MNNMIDNDSLSNKIANELQSARHYLSMAEEEQDIAEYKCFVAMAKDEYQHAEFFMEKMAAHGHVIPDATKADCAQVKQLIMSFR